MLNKHKLIQFNIFLLILISGLLIIGGRACSKQSGGGSNRVGNSGENPFTLNAPSSLSATAVSTSRINLSWQDNSPNAMGFEIERSLTTNTTYTLLATVSRGINIYSDTSVTPVNTYYYRVRAFNPIGDRSDWSNEANAFTFDYAWLPPFSAVAAGFAHTIARGTDGTIWAWGLNRGGQLGLGDADNRALPNPVETETNWQAIGCGQIHSLALKTDRTLWAWGSNLYGQLGTGDTDYDSWEPFPIGNDLDWSQLTAGYIHTFGLKTNGTLWGWGSNFVGQLGYMPTYNIILTPTQMGTDSDWSAVVASGGERTIGAGSTFARKTNGTLWAWGWNDSGQLGLGSTQSRFPPTPIGTDSDWASASSAESSTLVAGEAHSLALKTNLTLWSWGNNSSGQLGLGDTIDRNTPSAIGTDSDWSAVAAGGAHTIARKTNGTIWSWGANSYGQLGLGNWADRNTPTQIGTDSNWSIVAAGYNHSLGIKTNGIIWAWGNNMLMIGYDENYDPIYAYGQLGLGDTINRNIPCPLGSPAPPSKLVVTAVSSSQINLSWTDNSFNAERSGVPMTIGETGFRIERSTDGTNYELRTTTNANATSYSDIGISSDTLYYYRIRAYNTFGESPYSNEATPITLTAQAMAYNQIDLIWTSVIAAQSYLVERGTMAGGPYTTISTTNATTATVTSYSDETCFATTTYYYRVYAYYAGGDTMPSVEANATTPMSPPDTPSTSTAQAISPFSIVITWTDVISETGYKIERKFGASGTYAQLATTATDMVTYSDTTVTPTNTYYYQVRTYNTGGNSNYSPETNATTPQIPPPGTLTATVFSSNQIYLTWTDVTGEDGYDYKIYRSTDNITFTQIAVLTRYYDPYYFKPYFNYLDFGLSASQSYYYYIKSYYAGVESTISTSATATTLPNPPNAPGILTLDVVSSTQINLSWTGVTSADGYEIAHRVMTNTNYTSLGTVGSNPTSYSDTELAPMTIYYYRLRAFNAGGNSDYSTPVSATTMAATTPPSAPITLTATAISSTQINLSWTNVANETSYKIERSPDGSSYSQIATTGFDVVTYPDIGLSSTTTYYYQVRASNGVGDSGYSPPTNTLTLLPKPDALTATTFSSSQINLSWTNVTNNNGYKVERSISGSGGPYTQIGMAGKDTITYPDDTAITGTHTYYYRVRAIDERGFDGDESPEANAMTAGNWSTALSVRITTSSAFIGCKANGTLWIWGGSGAPSQIGTGTNWSTVAAGDGDPGPYYFARQTNGTLWSWENNLWGQLGLGSDSDVPVATPTQVVGSTSDWSQVACGQLFTIAIKTNGTIWSCGCNVLYGMLGLDNNIPDYNPHSTFTQIGWGTSDWSMVASGIAHSIARKTNGTIWTWGNNFYGALGRNGNELSPAPVGTTSDWSLITAGGYHTAAIKTDGSLWVWGQNERGQLGLGYSSPVDTAIITPTQVVGSSSDWSSVAGGYNYTIALKTNGSLWTWGNGYGGANPSQIGSDTDWSIIKGGQLSIARKTNGTLWKVTGMTTTLVGE